MSAPEDDPQTRAGGPRARGADTIVDEPPSLSDTESDSGSSDVDAKPRTLTRRVGYDARYQTRRELGAGGMGVVNLCVDTAIGREVAVKVMADDAFTRRLARDRFLREAQVQAQLEHPGVVPVYDIGETPDGKPYFSMRRIRGTTLMDAIEALRGGSPEAARRFPRRKLLSVIERVCETMAYAHSRGVVHRDLKPANIMLGDFGEVSVLDWGIAKLRTDTDLSDPSTGDNGPMPEYTAPGSVVGTAGYMAPEQASGLSGVDARADVYVLGALLFEAIALQPLHSGSVTERMRSTLAGADARPSQRTDDRVPPGLDAICVKACATKPNERYLDAADMLVDLRAFLNNTRQTELRRAVATQHAESARVSMAHQSTSETMRVAALRDLGAAAVLDPDNPEMIAMIESLLEPEPIEGELPEELAATLEEGRRKLASRAAGRSAITYAAALLFVPIFWWMGVQDWTWLSIFAVALIGSAIGAAAMWKLERATGIAALAAVPFSFGVLGILSTVFGPFFLVPGLIATTSVAFIVSVRADWRFRAMIYVCACMVVLVPFGLEELGWIEPSHQFVNDTIALQPHLVSFPELPTTVLLIGASLFVVLVPSMLVGRAVEELRRAELRQSAQSHRLRSMLPRSSNVRAR